MAWRSRIPVLGAWSRFQTQGRTLLFLKSQRKQNPEYCPYSCTNYKSGFPKTNLSFANSLEGPTELNGRWCSHVYGSVAENIQIESGPGKRYVGQGAAAISGKNFRLSSPLPVGLGTALTRPRKNVRHSAQSRAYQQAVPKPRCPELSHIRR